MYNTERKEAFLSLYSPSTAQTTRWTFNKIAPLEEKYGIDFCEMDFKQMQETILSVSGIKGATIATQKRSLLRYMEWCVSHHLARKESMADFLKASSEDHLGKVSEYMVKDPAHLKLSLDTAYPHPENRTIEYVYRTSIWMAYMGFLELEALQVCRENVDLTGRKIYIPERDQLYEIYPEALSDLSAVYFMDSFEEKQRRGVVRKERASGDLLLRGQKDNTSIDRFFFGTVRSTLSRRFKKMYNLAQMHPDQVPEGACLHITYERAYSSGIFYRTYQLEKRGIPVSFEREAQHEADFLYPDELYSMEPTVIQYRKAREKIKVIERKEQCYQADYPRWKKAFE